jgi:WD40 repeat protein
VSGRFDHFAIDAKGHRLFAAALGNDTLEIVDVRAAKHLHSIAGLKKPTGVLFLPDKNEIVVACGSDGTCRFYDGSSYELKATISKVDDADNLRFDAADDTIYLGYGDGALGVIDPKSHQLAGSIPLQGHPESFQLESNGSRIFVNVPDRKHIAVVDRARKQVLTTWPVEGSSQNFPMALDEKAHELFIGCRRPARLLIYDTQAGRKIAEATLAGDIDDLFFDPGTTRLYASCGEGFVDVFSRTRDGAWSRNSHIPSASGARTSFFSAVLNGYYLAVPKRIGQEAEIRIFQPQAAPK